MGAEDQSGQSSAFMLDFGFGSWPLERCLRDREGDWRLAKMKDDLFTARREASW